MGGVIGEAMQENMDASDVVRVFGLVDGFAALSASRRIHIWGSYPDAVFKLPDEALIDSVTGITWKDKNSIRVYYVKNESSEVMNQVK